MHLRRAVGVRTALRAWRFPLRRPAHNLEMRSRACRCLRRPAHGPGVVIRNGHGNGSLNTVAACSNLTLCLRRLSCALTGSQSKRCSNTAALPRGRTHARWTVPGAPRGSRPPTTLAGDNTSDTRLAPPERWSRFAPRRSSQAWVSSVRPVSRASQLARRRTPPNVPTDGDSCWYRSPRPRGLATFRRITWAGATALRAGAVGGGPPRTPHPELAVIGRHAGLRAPDHRTQVKYGRRRGCPASPHLVVSRIRSRTMRKPAAYLLPNNPALHPSRRLESRSETA